MNIIGLLSAVIAVTQHVCAQPGTITDETLTFAYPIKPREGNYAEHDLFAAGVHVHHVNHVVFNAKGQNAAHVLLQRDRSDFNNHVIEIVIGGWKNTKSALRDRQQGAEKATFQGAVLSSSEFKTFWASWDGNCIRVGKGYLVGQAEMMHWCGVTHKFNYVSAYYGFGNGGSFQFLKTAPQLTYYCEYRPNKVNYPQHDLFADGIDVRNSTSIVFTTKGRNDAYILLKRDRNDYVTHVIEVVLGGWANSRSVIRNKQLHKASYSEPAGIVSPIEDRHFWISWENNCIKVGKGYSVGRNDVMSWCGLTHGINYVSASYGFGSDGYFTFTRTAARINSCSSP